MAAREPTAPALARGLRTADQPEPLSNVDHTLLDRQRAAVAKLEALAALIIAKLDDIGIDADLEPVLGALECSGRSNVNQENWAAGDVNEREPEEDFEQPLGGLGDAYRQDRWGANGTDLEEEHDGREPDVDDEDGGDHEHNLGRSEAIDQSRPDHGADDLEPSLGSIGTYSAGADQRCWSQGDMTGYDPEWACEDEGAQCDDEGADFDDEGNPVPPCHPSNQSPFWPPVVR